MKTAIKNLISTVFATVVLTTSAFASTDDQKNTNVVTVLNQVKNINNIVEQDHRAVKRLTKSILGFKSLNAAKNILAGIELMHMIRKGQSHFTGSEEMSFADQFYALAREIRSV